QGFHVGEAVRRLRVVPANHRRAVVQDDDAVERDVAECLHDLPHVVVAVVHERFDEVWQRRADIAEVNLPDLLRAKVADHLFGIFPGQLLATLEPRAAAQTDPDVRAVGDLHRTLVALEVAEDASRYTGEHRHGRIVRVDADVDAHFLGNGRNLFYEVGVVLPDLVLRELAAVRERTGEHLAVPVAARVRAVLIELAGRRSTDRAPAARPDAVPHVRVCGVADPGLPEVAQVLLVLFDL